jgi:hypothetical protein
MIMAKRERERKGKVVKIKFFMSMYVRPSAFAIVVHEE